MGVLNFLSRRKAANPRKVGEELYLAQLEKEGNYSGLGHYYQTQAEKIGGVRYENGGKTRMIAGSPSARTKARIMYKKAGEAFLKDKKMLPFNDNAAAQCFIAAGDHKRAGEAYMHEAEQRRGYDWCQTLIRSADEYEKAGEHKKAAELLLKLNAKGYGQGLSNEDQEISNPDAMITRSLYRNLKKSGQYEKLKELQDAKKLGPFQANYERKIDEGLRRKYGRSI